MPFTDEEYGAMKDVVSKYFDVGFVSNLGGDTYLLRDSVSGRFIGGYDIYDLYHEIEHEIGAKAASEELLGFL